MQPDPFLPNVWPGPHHKQVDSSNKNAWFYVHIISSAPYVTEINRGFRHFLLLDSGRQKQEQIKQQDKKKNQSNSDNRE